MAAHNLSDKNAQCPFFRCHTAKTITCEGVIDGTTDQVSFEPGRSKKLQYELYCCLHYEQCPRHPVLMEKYEVITPDELKKMGAKWK